jgi:D-glycero-alpha-D-manno-heptose 1-phosphate guanylyltransferase
VFGSGGYIRSGFGANDASDCLINDMTVLRRDETYAAGPQANMSTKAVLLIGGLGTRLRSVVSSTPKVLASLGDTSVLELLVRQLRNQGFHRLVMCSGYLADQIESKFGDGRPWDVAIEYSRETKPLGTGGALKLAQKLLQENPEFLVMNGDSFLEIEFAKLMDFHLKRGALATMAVVSVENASRYGTVQIDSRSRVTNFFEKTGLDRAGVVNAGVYVFDRSVFDYIPEGRSSLEKEVFPRILRRGIYALEQSGMFIDVGTPDDYARARSLCEQLSTAASRR